MSLRPFASCALLLMACGGTSTSTGDRATAPLEPTTRDSAGVTLHEHPADALERAPLITMDSVPLAVFVGSADDPARDVSTIYFLTFTRTGDLVGYERGERQFVVLRTATQQQARHGKRGAGPLEIASGGMFVLLAGDTVLFKDGVNNRFVLAHPDTGVVRTISLSATKGLMSVGPLGRLGDSTYLLSEFVNQFTAQAPRSGIGYEENLLGTWQIAADSLRALMKIQVMQVFRIVNSGPTANSWTSAGHSLALAGVTRIGAWRDQFVMAKSTSWRVERWDTSGQLTAVIQVARPPLLADATLVARAVEAEVEMVLGYEPERNADSMRTVIAARPHADTVGVFERIEPMPDGRLWLLDYQLPGADGWAATLIDADGRIIGRMVEPTGEPPVAFGTDRLAFRTEDEDGIATITVRGIRLP